MTEGGAPQPDWIPERSLRRLNPGLIDDPAVIRNLLSRVKEAGLELRRGTNRAAVPEKASIVALADDRFLASLRNFETRNRRQVFLNFVLDGVRYFFAAKMIAKSRDHLELEFPRAIYRAERRDRPRELSTRPLTVLVDEQGEVLARQTDRSDDGIGLVFESGVALSPGQSVQLRDVEPGVKGSSFAEVRHVAERDVSGRWRRVGLLLTPDRRDEAFTWIAVPRFSHVQSRSEPAEQNSRVVAFQDKSGETLRAIVDIVGDPAVAAFAVIPPAWGRTKESTVGLAETLLSTFGEARESLVVVRFDGIRKRGESSNDPGCLPPLSENRHYTFSQGVRDIHSTVDFLEREYGARPGSIYLLTFSIAAVEGRRAIADDPRRRIGGWVSIVGAPDPQSMIRVVSGGVDYFAGAAHGLSFGQQYIQGLLLDVDHATADAIASRLAFLADARRDMSTIDVPVTWIAGSDDAWTSLERVQHMMSVGDTSRRRLLKVSTGHQLRSSDEAMETFALVAVEFGRMALGRRVEPIWPNRRELRRKRLTERARLKQREVDLQRFWRDYVVGREHDVGIEIVSSTEAFRSFMRTQIRCLELRGGEEVLDLGSGAGAFPVELGDTPDLGQMSVVAVDFVVEGLRRARKRVREGHCGAHSYNYVQANLQVHEAGASLPFASGSADAVLASLVINYLGDPSGFLREVARVLRPGGNAVISGMKPDADISKICVAGVTELRSGSARAVWTHEEMPSLDGPLQEFISSGARLLDLEEDGKFTFWPQDEFLSLVPRDLFKVSSVVLGYGDPPQALILVLERTRALSG